MKSRFTISLLKILAVVLALAQSTGQMPDELLGQDPIGSVASEGVAELGSSIAEEDPVNSDEPTVLEGAERQFVREGGSTACDSLCGEETRCSERTRQLPLWAATADALFLNRSAPSPRILAFNTANPVENLNANALDFGVHTGFDLSLNRQIDCDRSVELRYFGVDHWRSTYAAATAPNDLWQINSAVPLFTFSGRGVDANYASSLHNAELNMRRKCCENLSVLTGFRYAELDEKLSAALVASAIPFQYDATVRNRLYGFQIGGDVRLMERQYYSIDAFGKAGLYGNAAAQAGSFSTGIVGLNAAGRQSRTAFVGEAGAISKLRLTEHLMIRGGYRLLWFDGVAVASDQLAASDFFNGVGLNSSGHVFYHGALAGLELSF